MPPFSPLQSGGNGAYFDSFVEEFQEINETLSRHMPCSALTLRGDLAKRAKGISGERMAMAKARWQVCAWVRGERHVTRVQGVGCSATSRSRRLSRLPPGGSKHQTSFVYFRPISFLDPHRSVSGCGFLFSIFLGLGSAHTLGKEWYDHQKHRKPC